MTLCTFFIYLEKKGSLFEQSQLEKKNCLNVGQRKLERESGRKFRINTTREEFQN